jgi:hypothetical protein
MGGGGSASGAIQRDSEDLKTSDYIARHEVNLIVSAHNTALAQPYVTGSTFARFSDARAFAVAVLSDMSTVARVRELIAPKKLEAIVDRVRVHSIGDGIDPTSGPAEWMESVGTTVGSVLAEAVQTSLARLMPRYLDVRYQALLAQDVKDGTCSLVAPEPTAEQVVGSHPVDRPVAAALCSGVVTMAVAEYRAAHPDGKPEFRKPKIVALKVEAAMRGAYWVRCTDAAPATAEDIALTVFGASEQAYEITGRHPLFGFTHAAKLLEPMRSELLKGGEDPDAEQDPNAALLNPNNNMKALADEAAQAQGKGAATGSSKDEIVAKMRLDLGTLDEIIALAGKFGLSNRLAPARTALDERSKHLAAPEMPFAEVSKWDGQVNLEAGVLQRANFGLDAVRERLDLMTKGLGNLPPKFEELKLPDYAKQALLKVAIAYVDGAALCQVPQAASAKLEEADQLNITIALELLDGMLTEVTRVAMAEKKDGHSEAGYPIDNHPAYSSVDADLGKKEVVLRQELAKVRTLILSNPQGAAQALRDLSLKIQDLGSESEMIGNMDELDRLWARIHKVGPSLIPPGATSRDIMNAVDRMKGLQDRANGFIIRWRKAYELWKSGDNAQAKSIVDAIKTDPDLPKFLGECTTYFKDTAEAAAVQRIAILLGVVVVTMGVGAIAEGLAAGLELGTGGTILAVSGAEAVTFVALSQAFLDSDHSVGHIAAELVFNFAMFGALRRFSKFVEAAKIGAGAKFVTTLTGQTFISTAAGLAKAEIEKLVAQKGHLTEAEVKQVCFESVVIGVGMTLVAAGFSPILEDLQSAGKGLGAKIKLANAKAETAANLARVLDKAKPLEDALAAIKAHRAWADAKVEAYEALERVIAEEKLNPPKKGQSVFDKTKLTEEQIAALKQSTIDARATMKAAEAMLTLEPAGPNSFNCPKERIAKVLEDLGGKPETTITDPVTKLNTYTIKGPEGRTITIRETTFGPNAEGIDGKPNIAPELDISHLPESSQSIARWQTDGISHDAPSTWDKEAPDGRKFKDVYAEWMKQPERIRKNGDLWEPVLPANCPKEFEPIFKRIVEKGNISLTTQGEANVGKLKDAGIDLSKLDPLSPEYLAQRDKIIGILGEDAVRKWEATETDTGDGAKDDVAKRIHSVVAPEAIASLRAAFPDCEIVMSGSISQTGKPTTGKGGIADVDIFLVVPEGTPMESRIAMEKRASSMKLPTTPEFQKSNGPPELPVDVKAMTSEEYLGVRTVDPGKRTPLGAMRVDGNAPSSDDIAKRYNVGNDPAHLKVFEGLFKRDPVGAAQWANAMKTEPGLAGRLLGHFGEAAVAHFRPSGETVTIHGKIEITPQKLGSIPDADIARLVKCCQNNGPEAEFGYFEGSQSATRPGYRLRFLERLAARAKDTAAKVLAALGIGADDPRASIFNEMSPDDQSRMWDLAGEGEFGKAETRKQVAGWAMNNRPSSARQFVADFQFYTAEISRQTKLKFDAFTARVADRVAELTAAGNASIDPEAVRVQMAKAEFGATNPGKIRMKIRDGVVKEMGLPLAPGMSEMTEGDLLADAALKTNLDAQTGDNAAGKTELGASRVPGDLIARVQAKADSLSFANEHDAAYHAHKHASEMAKPPKLEDEMLAYLHEARDTIKHGTAEPPRPAQTTAGQGITFVNNGNQCIIAIDADGQALITTYLPAEKN